MNMWLVFQVVKKVLPLQAKEASSFLWYLCAYLALILPLAFCLWHFFIR